MDVHPTKNVSIGIDPYPCTNGLVVMLGKLPFLSNQHKSITVDGDGHILYGISTGFLWNKQAALQPHYENTQRLLHHGKFRFKPVRSSLVTGILIKRFTSSTALTPVLLSLRQQPYFLWMRP
jgi:hypothetical protein